MNSKLIKLEERRAALVARAASQRMELARAFDPWRNPLAIADQGLFALRFIARHKALVVGTLALAAALRPKRVLGWLRHGWLVWRLALAVKRSLGN